VVIVQPVYKTPIKRSGARRGVSKVLRCVRDEVNSPPTLEIPGWMFDSSISRMKQDGLAYVSRAALLALKSYCQQRLIPLNRPCSSGDADARQATPLNANCLPTGEAPQLPPEAHQKRVRLLARMLNDHLQRRPSPAREEVGDE